MSVYDEVKEYFSKIDDVVVNSGRGAQGVKLNNKMFIMFDKGNLLIKLSLDRIAELIADGIGEKHPYSKDRVIIPASLKDQWIEYAEESYQYVKGG